MNSLLLSKNGKGFFRVGSGGSGVDGAKRKTNERIGIGIDEDPCINMESMAKDIRGKHIDWSTLGDNCAVFHDHKVM